MFFLADVEISDKEDLLEKIGNLFRSMKEVVPAVYRFHELWGQKITSLLMEDGSLDFSNFNFGLSSAVGVLATPEWTVPVSLRSRLPTSK